MRAVAGIVIVDAEDCQLASERNNARRNELRDWARSRGPARLRPAQPRRACSGTWSSARAAARDSCRRRLVTSPAEIPRPPVDLHTIVEGPGSGTDGPTGALG